LIFCGKAGIGLKDYHEQNIISFLRFSRTQRTLNLRTVQAAFEDIQNARYFSDKELLHLDFYSVKVKSINKRLKDETTFTVDEVEELIGDLWDRTREEIDTELTYQSHTYVLLLRQLLLQAEHWHLKMQIDMSELENK
jgi:leucine zipper transcription factor-like protein 1